MSSARTESDRTRVTLYKSSQEGSLGGHHQTTSISKHYGVNNQILTAFESHYNKQLWEISFYLGLKFVETALFDIPKHGYFYSKKHAAEREQNSSDAVRVTGLLGDIISNEPSLSKESEKVEKLNYLAVIQLSSLDHYEQERKKVKAELYPKRRSHRGRRHGTKGTVDETNVDCMASSLEACGDSFSSIFCSTASVSKDTAQAIRDELSSSKMRFPDSGYHSSPKSTFPSTAPKAPQTGHHFPPAGLPPDKSTFPPRTKAPRRISSGDAMPPPTPLVQYQSDDCIPPPPSNTRRQSDIDLERALFLSGLQFAMEDDNRRKEEQKAMQSIEESRESLSPSRRQAPPGAKRRQQSSVTTKILAKFFRQGFEELKSEGRIRLSQVKTYQGKNPGSTNGCTIIAPLLCIHHFYNFEAIPDPGLPDGTIESVLDEETPTLLPVIREKMGLVECAFLIPQDAHEALYQENLLAPEQFQNVFGGNILQDSHLEALLKELNKYGEKKIAATFFFHEHVITILQLRRSPPDTLWFDIIDSLPHEETMCKSEATLTTFVNAKHSLSSEDAVVLSAGDENIIEGVLLDDIPEQEPAFRMRCLDVKALKAALQWYACSVFSIDDRTYIDTYHWDDNLADFDPRVFQAYIWAEPAL
jgi:hypothetical protein